MKKNIIITAGPTNEAIDAVMKITNMSTGALGSIVADTLIQEKDDSIGKIYYICPKLCYKPKIESDKFIFVKIDSTDDLLNALEDIFKKEDIYAIVHSSAVGDYKGEFVIRAEDIAEELHQFIQNTDKSNIDVSSILNILKNPTSLCNSQSKISSYEENLFVKLTLTTKVISKIKKFSPNTKLIGFKLLEGVAEEELYEVAHKLLLKNDANFIVANLLNRIGNGKHFAMIIDKEKVVKRCETKQEIANAITNLIFND